MECPDEPTLAEFARGKRGSAVRGAVEAHATACSVGAAILSGLAETRVDASGRSDRSGPSAAEPPVAGSLIGRFRVERMVGAGGMGVVYRALDPELHPPVALQLLPPQLLRPPAPPPPPPPAPPTAPPHHPNPP